MKASILCGAALFSLTTFAFPTSLLNSDISDATLAEITALADKITKEIETRRHPVVAKRGFNADAQLISTTGEHEYRAPGPNDLRGPCPGLNTMANHGYLPRNGIASAVELTTASNHVFGMSLDLAAVLSVYAAIMSGDIVSLSIGGKPKSGGLLGGLGSALGLLGEPQGLSWSHGRFEIDSSPTRADLFVTGDPVSVDLSHIEDIMALPKGPNGIDLSALVPYRVARLKETIATNGRFFQGPFGQLTLNAAVYFFTYRYFANHTADNLEGYLSEETLKSFEGVTGEKGSYQWASGQERIPENWYRRAVGDEYGIAGFALDSAAAILKYPELATIGGNTGEPNTFVGVDIADLTGGVFNAETLLQGNNLACFGFLAVNNFAPDILKGLLGNVVEAVSKLASVLDPVISELGCPQLAKYDTLLLEKFPGAKDAAI